jgi:hypothetical protein
VTFEIPVGISVEVEATGKRAAIELAKQIWDGMVDINLGGGFDTTSVPEQIESAGSLVPGGKWTAEDLDDGFVQTVRGTPRTGYGWV